MCRNPARRSRGPGLALAREPFPKEGEKGLRHTGGRPAAGRGGCRLVLLLSAGALLCDTVAERGTRTGRFPWSGGRLGARGNHPRVLT